MDFVSDRLQSGRRFRILTIVDDYTREWKAAVVDTSIGGIRVVRLLEELRETTGLPTAIVTDNGPEFTSRAFLSWAEQRGIDLRFIQPGKPTQNAFVESFNGKFRLECLDTHWFTTLDDARREIDDLARRLQRRPPAQLARRPDAVGVRGGPPRGGRLICTFPRFPPRDDCYDFNPESPNPIWPQEGSRSAEQTYHRHDLVSLVEGRRFPVGPDTVEILTDAAAHLRIRQQVLRREMVEQQVVAKASAGKRAALVERAQRTRSSHD